jgi:hypothetical protein
MPESGEDMPSAEHYTSQLKLLIGAADKFWKNADPKDVESYRTNQEVAEWLTQHGLSKRQANVGATIIRPKWAAKGRKPGK